MPKPRVTLPGSERSQLKGAKVVARVSPDERLTVTLVLKPTTAAPPQPGRFLSPAEFAARHAASPDAIHIVRQFASDHGLAIISEDPVKHTVRLAGSASDMNAAFGVDLQRVELDGKTYRHRVGPITVPSDVASVVMAVMGLDNRPQASPRSSFLERGSVEPHAGTGLLTPVQVAKLYNFPTGVTGSGETVAIIELGGGFSQADLNTYFSGLGLSTMPSVSAVPVSAANNPGVNIGDDREVMLDIEVVGGIAPGAKQLVYFAKNTDQDFLNATLAAIHANPAPTALSISWGGPEADSTAQSRQAFTQAFQDAATLGISVFVASGDAGSSDGTQGLAVDFPASSPAAIGCGGTTITASGTTITSEVTWNDAPDLCTGGGVSIFFPKPAFQSVSVPPPPSGNSGGRGVPDVSGHAAGWAVRVNGSDSGAAGTSAVAPMWAGLTALLAQKLNRPLGFLNSQLYLNTVTPSSFRDITSGNNDSNGDLGKYNAGAGWDACTGLGSPKGTALATALAAVHPPTPTPTPHPPTPTPTPHPPTPTPTPHPPTPTPHPPTPTPHPPTPHPPTPHPPTPHPPTPHPPTPHPGSGGTGTSGHAAFTFPEMPPYPVTPEPPIPAPVTVTSAPSGGNTVAIVAVVGLAALMGMVAATGVVGVVAINKDKS